MEVQQQIFQIKALILLKCLTQWIVIYTHAKIPDYFNVVDQAAKESGKTSIISVGWDPGLFSVNRLMAEAILPKG